MDLNKKLEGIEGFLLPEERNFLFLSGRKAKKGIVEIGSFKGLSTALLALGSQEGNKVKVYAVDPHTGAEIERQLFNQGNPMWTFPEFQKNMTRAGVDDLVIPMVCTSLEAANKLTGKDIDLVWIDGDHSYSSARLDFLNWAQILCEGGIIAFHDSTNPFFGVMKMQKELLFTDKRFTKYGLRDGIVFAVKEKDKRRFLHVIKIKLLISLIVFARSIPFTSRLKSLAKKILYRK